MSSSDSKPHNEREWDDLLEELNTLDDPDAVGAYAYAEEGRVQMAYGCYRLLKCKGAE